MKISLTQYERLLLFLDMEMSVSEMESFEKELASDADLREALLSEEQMREGMETVYREEDDEDMNASGDLNDDEQQAMRNHIEEIGRQWKNERNNVLSFSGTDHQSEPADEAVNKPPVLKIQFPFAVAATLLVAIALVYLFNTMVPSSNKVVVKNRDTGNIKKKDRDMVKTPADTILQSPEKRTVNLASLFSSFYKKDTLPQQKPDIYASAFSDYNDNYYRTIQKIDAFNLPEARGAETEFRNSKKYVATVGHYYTGLSLIETNNLPQAIRNLQWVKDSTDDKSYTVKAQWYLSLAYLKGGKTDSAKVLLQKVSTNTAIASYQTKAKELLKKME